MTDTTNLSRLEGLVKRLERLGVNLAPDTRAAEDAYGNPGYVATGELIESAWGNAVADHVVREYPDLTTLTSATAADGATAMTLDTGSLFIRRGGAWEHTRGTVAQVQYINFPSVPFTAPGIYDLGTTSLLNRLSGNYASTIVAYVEAGFSGSPVTYAVDAARIFDGASMGGINPPSPIAGAYSGGTVVAGFSALGGQSADFKVRLHINSLPGGATMYAGGHAIAQLIKIG